MTFFYLDPEIYQKYRDRVLELSNSIQVDINEHLPEQASGAGFRRREGSVGLAKQRTHRRRERNKNPC